MIDCIINELTPLVQPKNVFQPRHKLLNLLLEKYPPRFERVEVTLGEDHVANFGEESVRLGEKSFQVKPISPNTTIITTSDGGTGDEKQR